MNFISWGLTFKTTNVDEFLGSGPLYSKSGSCPYVVISVTPVSCSNYGTVGSSNCRVRTIRNAYVEGENVWAHCPSTRPKHGAEPHWKQDNLDCLWPSIHRTKSSVSVHIMRNWRRETQGLYRQPNQNADCTQRTKDLSTTPGVWKVVSRLALSTVLHLCRSGKKVKKSHDQ